MGNPYAGASLKYLAKQLEGGPYYTTSEVAVLIQKSIDTVRRYRKNAEAPQPSVLLRVGQVDMNLYTEEDVEALRVWMRTVKPGWPKGRPRKNRGIEMEVGSGQDRTRKSA